MNPKRQVAAAALCAMLSMAGTPIAWSADTGSTSPPVATPKDPLDAARKRIEQQDWAAALRELKRLNATANADWQNLMGYTLRKQAQPDLDGAQAHYDEALRLKPAHLGALEYAGELALMKGDLAKAEARLAALAQACRSSCEEHADLAKAVARYKANGNRYLP